MYQNNKNVNSNFWKLRYIIKKLFHNKTEAKAMRYINKNCKVRIK